jgi:hypothetical protein
MPVATDPILQYFSFEHLHRDDLKQVSSKFHALANDLASTLPRNAERTVALRKLLEAKDAAVRAAIHKSVDDPEPYVGRDSN